MRIERTDEPRTFRSMRCTAYHRGTCSSEDDDADSSDEEADPGLPVGSWQETTKRRARKEKTNRPRIFNVPTINENWCFIVTSEAFRHACTTGVQGYRWVRHWEEEGEKGKLWLVYDNIWCRALSHPLITVGKSVGCDHMISKRSLAKFLHRSYLQIYRFSSQLVKKVLTLFWGIILSSFPDFL